MAQGQLTNREAVLFWLGRIVSHIEANGFPDELGFIGKLAMPFIGKIADKAAGMTEEQAADLVRGIHSLSARLEDQTGVDSPFHYERDDSSEGN